MEQKKFYITTAIAYASRKPHIGNSYDIVLADMIARYKRKKGFDVHFLTGSDEHGQKIEENAKEMGVTPKELVDQVAGQIKSVWDCLNVTYDRFIRTTDADHEDAVKKIFKKLYEQDDIYKSVYEGKYCVPCESFFTASQLVDGKCPDCGRECIDSKEESYFLRLSKYQDRLVEYYESMPDFFQPASRKAEMVNNFIKPGLADLCVSRSTFSWGVPVEFDEKHVIYVWIDALSNYITGVGYNPDGSSDMYKKYWPADLHVIGKDIVRFHSIYWPIILMALGEPLPKQILAHPWLLSGDDKMSKSKGNVVDPLDVVNEFGADVLRVYVLFMGDYASATPWSENSVRGCKRFLDRVASLLDMAKGSGVTQKLESAFHKTIKKVTSDIEEMKFNTAIAALMTLLNDIYEVGSITTDEVKTYAKLLAPFAPHISEEIWETLGGEGFISLTPWPEYDEAKTKDSEIEIAVQICGKLKATVWINVEMTQAEALAVAKADERVQQALVGKQIVKEIYIPGKIINIVAK